MAFTRETVQVTSEGGTTGATIASPTFNLGAGRLVVVGVKVEHATGGAMSVADTAGNTYTPLTIQYNATDNFQCQLFYCLNSTANASNVVTATVPAASDFKNIAVHPYLPAGTASFVAQSGNNSTTASANPSSAAITAGDCAVIVGLEFFGQLATADAGWTEQYDPGTTNGCHGFDRIDSPGGTITPSFSYSTSTAYALAAASFSDVAGGATATPSAGALTLAGLAPTTISPIIVSPPAGTLSLASDPPQIGQYIFLVGDINVNDGSYVGGQNLVGGINPGFVQTLSPDIGSLTFTGLFPSVVVSGGGGGSTVTPSAGALTLAGLAPSLLTNYIPTPSAGALTLAGLAPAAVQDSTRQPGAGALVLAGLAPATVQNSVRQPGAGTLTLTGLAPSLLTNYTPVPGTGALVLAGLSPSLLVATIVQPGAGALTLAGLAPSLLVAQAVSPGAGALVLAGLAPSLLVNQIVQPAAGALVLAGQQPAVLNGDARVAQPPAGGLVLTGLAPVAATTDNRTAAPGSGALALAGLAPSVLSGFTVTPSTGALVLAGLTPTVAATDNRTVAPGTGALVLAGATPAAAVSDNRTVAPGTGALALAGLAPTIPVQSPNVTPDAGTLALEGLAPTVDSGEGNSLLSAKYLGFPNVVIRGLKAGGKAEPEDPLPADITNMPDAPPPPKPRASGLAILGSLTAPEPQPVETPQVKAPAIKAPPRVAEAPTPAAEPPLAPPVEPPAPVPLPKPPSRVAQVAKTVESVQAAVQVQNEYLIEQFTALNARISELQDALAASIAQVEETRARKERNQRRAEEITRKLLMNDD